jgi:hypothetical protein
MAITAHLFPTFLSALASKSVALGTDTVNVILIGTGTNLLPTSVTSTVEAMTTKASIMANGSSALAEVSGAGYTTGGLALTAADFSTANSLSGSTNYTSVTYSGTIQWTSATFTAYQAVFIDTTANQGICYWDLGGASPVSGGTFQLNLGTANGVSNVLVQFTSS